MSPETKVHLETADLEYIYERIHHDNIIIILIIASHNLRLICHVMFLDSCSSPLTSGYRLSSPIRLNLSLLNI